MKSHHAILRTRTTALALSWLVAACASARGQPIDYPTRPITVVSPYAAGGLGTVLVQRMAPALERRLGQPVVAEAKPGAGSVTGSLAVAQSPPDGYTLLINTTSGLTTHLTMKKTPAYNPQTELVAVALIANIPQVLVVNAALPVHSVADIANLATTRNLTFASSGIGTSQHLAGEILRSTLNIDMTHVPYRGAAQAIEDVAGGHVSMMFSDVLNALPLVERGALRMIFVLAPRRMAAIPDVPAASELKLAGFEEPTTFMILAPAGTPAPIVEKLNGAIGAVVGQPDLSGWIAERGLVPADPLSPTQLRVFMAAQVAYWAEAVRKAGLAGSQ